MGDWDGLKKEVRETDLKFKKIKKRYNNLKQGKIMKKIYILGGGTFGNVRNHLDLTTNVIEDRGDPLGLSARAFGSTAKVLANLFQEKSKDYEIHLVLTKMADPVGSELITNQDVAKLVDTWIKDPETKAIIMNAALCDFEGEIGTIESGPHAARLETKSGVAMMKLTPSEKILKTIRKDRKDIFVVGFKTTCHASEKEQYQKALSLLKNNSINLVLANDTGTHKNKIVAPEETIYGLGKSREEVLELIVEMTLSRMNNTFTRSSVIEGEAVAWDDEKIPQSLRQVVNFCIDRGAYKPFEGKTVGHFAMKVDEENIYTSIRKSNFNELKTTGLVHVTSKGDHEVIARGFKPSVGGQSQRIIFKEHPDLDCIVHFHCPPKKEVEATLSIKEQWPNECGSHECGKSTSSGLKEVTLENGDRIKVVYLNDHGPNIVFNRNADANEIVKYIDHHFDLNQKTGGLVS